MQVSSFFGKNHPSVDQQTKFPILQDKVLDIFGIDEYEIEHELDDVLPSKLSILHDQIQYGNDLLQNRRSRLRVERKEKFKRRHVRVSM